VGTATFSHDPRGSFVTVDDDDARWLVGDATPDAAAAPASDDLAAARQRRLSAVGEDAPLGDDAIEMVTAEEPSATPEETTMELADPGLGAEQPVEAYLDEGPVEQHHSPAPARETEQPQPEAEPAAEAPAEPKPKPARKRGRASVPSWDEIMFGGGKGD
jgi:hypothetical protein